MKKNMYTNLLTLVMSVTMVAGQRPSFAGSRPIGYPEVIKTTTEGLGNRFGEGDATTIRLPLEAKGDKDLVDRLSKLPVDQQPFWFINWQAYEAQRQNPQTYPQKPNVFVDTASNMNPSNNFNNPNMNFNNPPNNFNNPPNNFNNPPNNFNNPPNNVNNPPNNFNNPPNNFNSIPSFSIAPQTTQQPQNGNSDTDLNNRHGDGSDLLVPQKGETQATETNININNMEKPQEYIIVNGVLYRVVESQKPK